MVPRVLLGRGRTLSQPSFNPTASPKSTARTQFGNGPTELDISISWSGSMISSSAHLMTPPLTTSKQLSSPASRGQTTDPFANMWASMSHDLQTSKLRTSLKNPSFENFSKDLVCSTAPLSSLLWSQALFSRRQIAQPSPTPNADKNTRNTSDPFFISASTLAQTSALPSTSWRSTCQIPVRSTVSRLRGGRTPDEGGRASRSAEKRSSFNWITEEKKVGTHERSSGHRPWFHIW